MRKAAVIAAGVGAVGLVVWILLGASGRETRRMAGLADESETVVLAVIEGVAEPGRDGTTQRVTYRVEEVLKGYRVGAFEVEYRLMDGPETDTVGGRRALSSALFRVGARQLLFLRQARYGPAGGATTEDASRAVEATGERIEALRKKLLQ